MSLVSMESFEDVKALGALNTISSSFSQPFVGADFFGGFKGAIGVVTELEVEFWWLVCLVIWKLWDRCELFVDMFG